MKIKQAKLSGAGIYLGVLATTTIVAGSALVIPNVAADNSIVDTVQVTIQPSCTLGGEGGFYSVELLNGTKNENIGSTAITAYCNDSEGFGIYAVGASDDHEGDTYMHHDTDSTHDFNTGTTFSGATSAWAMKLAATTGTYTPSISTGFDSFHTVPTQYTMVAYRDATDGGTDKEDDTDAEGATITTTYGVYVSGTQAPGTYTGKVRYALIHPYSNTNLVSLEKALTDATAPTKTVGGKTYFTMQGMTSGICANANIIGEGSQLKMVDNRDDKIYYVTKLADGHCWMTQNLDLDLETTPTNVAALTSENTDLTTYGSGGYDSEHGYAIDANDVITWTPGSTTLTPSNGSFSGWVGGFDNPPPASADPGDWYWDNTWYDSNECLDSSSNDICNYLNGNQAGKFSQSSSTFSNGAHGHVGNYYNWTAAIASNDPSSYTSDTSSDISGNPQNSICPAGWRLPTTSNAADEPGSTNEFRRLVTLYGNTISTDANFIASPLYFVRGGLVSGSLYYSGSKGYYWSSTVRNRNYAKYLVFYSSFVIPADPYFKDFGNPVRCIAK